MIENDNQNFAFGKKLGISDCLYGDPIAISNMIAKMMVCMKNTNQKHGVQCEFFRLDFRQPYFDEEMQFPIGALILDMKWGSRKELESKNVCNDKQLSPKANMNS